MRTTLRLAPALFLLAAACGGDAQPDAEVTDSLPAEAAAPDSASPRVITGVTTADTLEGLAPMICDDGLMLHSTYWIGENPRVVLGTPDTVLVLARVPSASGAKYAVASPAMEWWSRGDTATFTRGGKAVTCVRAEPGEVDI